MIGKKIKNNVIAAVAYTPTVTTSMHLLKDKCKDYPPRRQMIS
jgi:hypothetical protein